MQQATYQGLHVRDAHDAHVVFEAVRQGFLMPVIKRLNDTERAMLIRPGAIFVWFESEDENGLKRWTGKTILIKLSIKYDLFRNLDGRIWSQSRMREVILSLVVKLRCSNTSISSLISFMMRECRMIIPKPPPRPVGV